MIIAEPSHPVFLAAQDALAFHDGRYTLTSEGVRNYRQTLLRYAGDPTLVNGVQAIIELAHHVYEHPDSQTTASEMLNIVARLRPYLPAICRIPTTDRPIRRLGVAPVRRRRRGRAVTPPMRVGTAPRVEA